MVSLYKIEKTSLRNDADYISCELRGLSRDDKPTEINGKTIENGSVFIEIDTGKIYMYNIESQSWSEI